MDKLRKIRNRQQARFVKHLERTGQYSPALEKDVVRSFGFFEEDVAAMMDKGGNVPLVPLNLDSDAQAEYKAHQISHGLVREGGE